MERQTTTVAAWAGTPPLLLLLLLAVGFGAPGAGDQPAASPQPRASPTAPPPEGQDAQALLARVLGQERDAWAECRGCPGGLPEVRVLLATLPDPRDSHQAYDFDHYLESIRRAGEAAGYVLVDFYLPWRQPPADATPATAGGSAYRRVPGVLVFRAPRPASLLVVWLVGETPTTGVQRAALRAAFEQMRGVCASLRPRPHSCDEVPVLGPSFSGSIESLSAELYRQGQSWPRFRIISGSATAVEPRTLLARLPARSSFHATVAPDALTLPAMIGYLEGLGVERRRIALLVEGNTSYGQGASVALKDVRVVPFPSQVGRLRRAYEQRRETADSGRATAWAMAPQLRRLLLEDSDADTVDVPPVFSAVDSHSTEVALAANLAALSREGVQYVGLLATDVRDKLFLGQQVRRFCPGSVLFTLDADILFLHPDLTRSFEGTLVIAPYPLVSANQRWSFPFEGDRRRLQFPSTNAQGVYNAALALLGREESLLEYSAPFSEAATYGRPPLWISVVGNDAFWPLRVIQHAGEVERQPYVFGRPPPATGAPRPADARVASSGWNAALVMLQVLLWAVCLLALGAELELRSAPGRGLGAFAGPLRNPSTAAARETRACYLWVVLMSCLSLLLAVGAVATLGHSFAERLLYFTAAGLLAMLGWASLDGLPAIARAARQLWRGRHRLHQVDDVASVASSVLVLACAAAFAWSVHHADETTRSFVYLRATQLLGGLSPLPPLFLLGLAGLLWGLCALMRVHLLDAFPRGPEARFLNFDSPALPGLPRLEDNLLEALSARSPGPGGLLLAWLAIFVPWWQLFVSSAVPGFEGAAFHWLLGASLFVVATGTLVNVLAFHRLWARLRPLLRRVAARHELVGACRALDPALSWSAMLDLGARVPAFSDLAEAVDQARRFCRAAPADRIDEWIPAHAERAGETLRKALEAAAERNRGAAVEARLALQALLAKLAPAILQAWETWPRPEPGGEPPAWERPALAFLASRVAGLTRQVFAHMRGLLLFSTGSLLLVLLAVVSYPIEPRGMFLVFCWTLILGVVGATMLALTAIERDVVLSALANTADGKLDLNRDFLSRVLVHGGVPLLGLLAAQFPGVFRQIAAWLEPLLGH